MKLILMYLFINYGAVKGKVLEKGTSKPVEYAVVIVFDKSGKQAGGTYADSTGEFLIERLKPGKYYATVDFIGYQKAQTDTFTIKNGDVKDLGVIYLSPSYIKTSPVKVTAKAPRVRREVDRTIVTPSQDVISSGGNASDVLRNVPGVSVSITGEVLIKNSKNYTVLFNNKPTLLEPSQVLKEIPASQIERIEIITNPSAEYDPESNAIVNIVLKKSTYKVENSFSLRFGTFSNYGVSFTLGAVKGKNSFYGMGNYNKYSQALQYEMEMKNPSDTISLDKTNFYSHDLPKNIRLGANLKIGKHATLTFDGEAGKYILDYSGDFLYRSDSGSYRNPIFAKWTSNFFSGSIDFSRDFESGSIDASLYAGKLDTDKSHEAPKIADGDTVGGIRMKGDGSLNQLRFDLSADKIIGKFKLSTGYRYSMKKFESTTSTQIIGDSTYENPLNSRRVVNAGYVKIKSSYRKLNYAVGLRFEGTDRKIGSFTIKRSDIFPSFYVSTRMSQFSKLSFSYSRRIRRPSAYDLNPVDVWETSNEVHKGNPSLKPQFNDSYELSFETPLREKIYLSASGYYLYSKDYFNKVEEVGDSGIIVKKEVNFPYRREIGGNFDLEWKLSRFMRFTLSPEIYHYRFKKDTGIEDGMFYMVRAMFSGLVIPIGFIQAGVQYIGPYTETFGKMAPVFGAQFGYMIQIKNIAVTLAFMDVFHTYKSSWTNESDGNYIHKEMSMRYPSISISIRYINRKLQIGKEEKINSEDIKSM